MRLLLALLTLIVPCAYADFAYTPPVIGVAWYTNDATDGMGNPTIPYMQVSNSILTLTPGSLNFPLQGVSATFLSTGPSSVTCDTAHGGTMKRASGSNDMLWCDGSGWVDVTTSLNNVITSASTINAGLGAKVNQTTYNALVASTTTAIEAKVSASALTSLTGIVNGKQASLGTSATTTYLRGDLAWTTLPVASRTINSQARSLNSCFQVSSTKDALVTYSVDIASTLSLTGGQTGTVFLEYSDNSGCSTNTTEVSRFVNGNTGTLTIGLNITQNATGTLTGMVPAGKWVQLRTANTAGTPAFTFRSGQEVLF